MEAEASTEIHQQQQSIQMRLKVLFAALSAMGGLVLASGTDGSALSVIAVFFALCLTLAAGGKGSSLLLHALYSSAHVIDSSSYCNF